MTRNGEKYVFVLNILINRNVERGIKFVLFIGLSFGKCGINRKKIPLF